MQLKRQHLFHLFIILSSLVLFSCLFLTSNQKSIHDEVTEVWHHSQTIGIFLLKGAQRTLVKCQLILIEGAR